ncbi:MAG: hypothetical protein A2068_04785 [Ignavibacteria bacterium GWB2_35_6b]|nr:MAG: hypothetical protein A2068_04785 [Ignavibacteria bacterium GWB2_35_6b]
MKKHIGIFVLILLSGCGDEILNPSENLSIVPVMEIQMSQDNLNSLRVNRTNDAGYFVNIFYKGEKKKAELEASGAGSRYNPRWSYKIELENGETIEGLSAFNLSAQIYDPTMLNTAIALNYYEQVGLPVFHNSHVFLKINNEDEALLVLLERVEEEYFRKRNLPVFQLFKVGFGAKFSSEGGFYPQFHFEKKIPEDNSFYYLEQLINAIDTSSNENLNSSLGKFIDIKNYIKYHAATSILNNDDSFNNNFFLIKETKDSPFKIIPWDFDKCFSRVNDVKFAGENSIIKKIFKNPITFEWYKNELVYQLENIYTEEKLFKVIDSTASVIREAYNIDPYLGKERYNFENEIEKLKNYISERRAYLRNNITNLSQNYFN